MSAIRLSRPGYPTELRVIDDGAVGRVTHTRSGIRGSIGGALVTPVTRHRTHDREKEAAARRAREAA